MSIIGSLCHALAHKTNFLYLTLIGRMIMGVAFTFFMYAKKYCSDPRIVGIRRRTTLAACLVVGQGTGLSLGPFLGGALYRIGFGPNGDRLVFNGFTSPGWLMAAAWLLFWGAVTFFFEDVQEATPLSPRTSGIELQSPQQQSQEQPTNIPSPQLSRPTSLSQDIDEREEFILGLSQMGVIVTMCWFAMTCFFILGSWEANIPVFAASPQSSLGYSPFKSGNLIAIGGATAFPLLLANLFVGKMVQDRVTLAAGSFIGVVGLVMFEALLVKSSRGVTFPTLLVSWIFVALGFNLSTTCTLSLLSKKLPSEWNARVSTAIQCSNYIVRVTSQRPTAIVRLTTRFPGSCRRCYLGGIRRDSRDEKLRWFTDCFRGDRERLVLHPLEGSQGKNGVAGCDSTRDSCMPVCSPCHKERNGFPSDRLRSSPISNPKTV